MTPAVFRQLIMRKITQMRYYQLESYLYIGRPSVRLETFIRVTLSR